MDIEEHKDSPNDEGWSVSVLEALGMLLVLFALALIILPSFIRTRRGYSPTACKSNLKNIGTAMEMYSTDWGGRYPPAPALEKLTPKYLRTLPQCPAAGSVTYQAQVGQVANNNPGFQDYYYVECHGENHTAVSVMANYPAYDSISGLIERP